MPPKMALSVFAAPRRTSSRSPSTFGSPGRASFRTRETVATDAGVGVEAATTLEVPGRALTADERAELAR